MNRLVLFVARFHPRSWRARYGDEFDQLLRDEEGSVGVLLDVLVNALRAQLRHGGSIMTRGVRHHPERLALVGLALMVPSAVLVTAAVLKYIVGVPGPFDAIEPSITPIVTHPVGETFFILAPYGALLLPAVPVTRLGVSATAGRMRATIEVTAPLANVAIAIASILLAAVMLLYWLAENL